LTRRAGHSFLLRKKFVLSAHVFDLDRTLVADYQRFARSFAQIRAQDIRDQVDAIYASRRFWPEPLITTNSHYERGASVEALTLDSHQSQIWC